MNESLGSEQLLGVEASYPEETDIPCNSRLVAGNNKQLVTYNEFPFPVTKTELLYITKVT